MAATWRHIGAGLGHDDFHGAKLHGRVGHHAFEGITLFAEERERMPTSLGDQRVLFLRNHGVAAAEIDIPRTLFLPWTVQRAAEIQGAAGAVPGDNVALPDAIGRRCGMRAAQPIREDDFADKVFDAMVRTMQARRR